MTPEKKPTSLNPNMKKVTVIASIALGAILLGALIYGVLNALVGGGAWSTGWNDYRYDDSNFEMGEGSIPAQMLTEIEIDWLDGAVLILPCEDAYPSLTEETADGAALPDSARVRWCVEGEKLTVKYRASSWFFGLGKQSRNKTLTLRIPEAMLSGLQELDVTTTSGNVVLDRLDLAALEVETVSGNIRVQNTTLEGLSIENNSGITELFCNLRGRLEIETLSGAVSFASDICPQSLEVETKSADVSLMLPADAAFALTFESQSGHLSSDFAYTQNENRYTVGNGTAQFTVKTQSGDLLLAKHAAAE